MAISNNRNLAKSQILFFDNPEFNLNINHMANEPQGIGYEMRGEAIMTDVTATSVVATPLFMMPISIAREIIFGGGTREQIAKANIFLAGLQGGGILGDGVIHYSNDQHKPVNFYNACITRVQPNADQTRLIIEISAAIKINQDYLGG